MIQGNYYQWMKNNYSIAGAVTAKLQFSNLTAVDAGIYQCKIMTDSGMINSRQISVSVPVGINEVPPLPPSFALKQNYPNPFNSSTTLSYGISKDGLVILNIYNIKGQLVTKLVSNPQKKGAYKVIWNGTDQTGKKVSAGLYFSRLEANGKTLTSKMLMLK